MQKKMFINNINFLEECYTSSYYRFLKYGLYSIFSENFNPIYTVINSKIVFNEKAYLFKLFIELFLYPNSSKLFFPKQNSSNCIHFNLTYYATFFLECEYLINTKKIKISRSLKIVEFPFLTHNGYFILDGCERIIINQISKSPGIYFFNKTKKKGYLFYPYIISNNGNSLSLFSVPNIQTTLEKIKKNSKFQPIIQPLIFFKKIKNFKNEIKFYERYNIKNNRETTNLKKHKKLFIFSKKNIFIDNFSLFEAKKSNKALLPYNFYNIKNNTLRNNILKEFALTFDNILNFYKEKSSLYFNENFSFINNKNFNIENIANDELSYISYTLLQSNFKPKFSLKTERQFKNKETIIKKTLNNIEFSLFFNKNQGGLYIGKFGRLQVNNKLNLKISNDICYITSFDLDRIYRLSTKNFSSLLLKKEDSFDSLLNKKFESSGNLLIQKLNIAINFFYNQCLLKNLNISFLEEKNGILLFETPYLKQAISELNKSNPLLHLLQSANPYSIISQKRKNSLLNAKQNSSLSGNISIRDIHTSQYGRICYIDTAEGESVGLTSSLSLLSKCNSFGQLLTPYFLTNIYNLNSKNNLYFVSTSVEEKITIGLYSNFSKKTIIKKLPVKKKNIFILENLKDCHLLTISPFQTISLGIGLVPFLEHNDASRTLMGSNMQKQAVPIIYKQKPIVGTGLEAIVGQDNGFTLKSYSQGTACHVSGNSIKIKDILNQVINYPLKKHAFAYEHTTINQTASIWPDQKIFCGQVIADAPATLNGELSLGANLLVGYLPWEGYNYEDGITLSERIIEDQCLSSVTICDYFVEINKSKFGTDVLTNSLSSLQSKKNDLRIFGYSGLIKKGSYVSKGEILIRKFSPIGYFLYKFSKEKNIEFFTICDYLKNLNKKTNLTRKLFYKILLKLDSRKKKKLDCFKKVFKTYSKAFLYKRFLKLYSRVSLNLLSNHFYEDTSCYLENGQGRIINIKKLASQKISVYKKSSFINSYDDNNKIINHYSFEKIIVSIAQVRFLEIGDKLSGRHGNKGIISRVLPKTDMPYLPDGKPLDIILNPLGVPSRMNIGQLFESSLGFTGYLCGKRFNILPFDENFCKNASQDYISLKKKQSSFLANIKWFFDKNFESKILLREGRTGDLLDNPISVGLSYILKLVHVVQDKLHSRVAQKYSKISEQPLGGRINNGGQRFGEMEVWALEAHGASYTLQELLTIKSDDLETRKLNFSFLSNKKNARKFQSFFAESIFLAINFLNCLGLSFSLNKILDFSHVSKSNIKTTQNLVFNDIETHLKIKKFLRFSGKNKEKIL